MISLETLQILAKIKKSPDLTANISGENKIKGSAYFWGTKWGVVCLFDINNLPERKFLGLHIHEFGECKAPKYESAGGHFNPTNTTHPNHAGDLPPLYTNEGHALSAVLIDKFTINDIKGRSVIIHSQADDFTTQPAGNSGVRIACGVIR